MKAELAYGRTGLTVELPDHAQLLRPTFVAGVADERAALTSALRAPISSAPLSELAAGKRRVVITHSDITRATPNDRILPPLLAELAAAGVADEQITLINALGTHRQQTDAELRALLGIDDDGRATVDRFRCLQHDAWDDGQLVPVTTTARGSAVRLNRAVVEADLVIFTGFIEPHFFAGFSGGPKGALPALAGHESVFTNHGFEMIGAEAATWGVTRGNPIWDEMLEVALCLEPLFLLNVTLNATGEITGVFCGDLQAAHAEGCARVGETAMVPVAEPYDVVLTTNSGYPLDQNLYQTVKGMKAAAGIVRNGGAIVMAAACADGLPDHGRYAELLAAAGTPERVLQQVAAPGFSAHDQWQVQVQAQIQQRADVYVYSDGLSDEQIRGAMLLPCRSIEDTLAELRPERLCVLPEGPQTIAYLA
jgi:nickel-dependent lactate racemase